MRRATKIISLVIIIAAGVMVWFFIQELPDGVKVLIMALIIWLFVMMLLDKDDR